MLRIEKTLQVQFYSISQGTTVLSSTSFAYIDIHTHSLAFPHVGHHRLSLPCPHHSRFSPAAYVTHSNVCICQSQPLSPSLSTLIP